MRTRNRSLELRIKMDMVEWLSLLKLLRERNLESEAEQLGQMIREETHVKDKG